MDIKYCYNIKKINNIRLELHFEKGEDLAWHEKRYEPPDNQLER